MIDTKEKYNYEWFKNRAIKSIKKIGKDVWDYSDSLLLYVSSGTEVYESIQDTEAPYFKLVTNPERQYLQSIAKSIASSIPNNFEYIDLGPGTEHKEQFFFDEFKKQGKEFVYIPVDISEYYLDLSEKFARGQGIEVRSIMSSFEELPELFTQATKPRFISLGLTFSNFDPQEIMKLLVSIAGENGFIFINTQMKDRVDIDELQKVYQDFVPDLCKKKMELVGLHLEETTSQVSVDEGIKVWYEVSQSNELLENIGIAIGSKLVILQSLRYTKESLESELRKTKLKYELFDTGSSFIASLIKT